MYYNVLSANCSNDNGQEALFSVAKMATPTVHTLDKIKYSEKVMQLKLNEIQLVITYWF